MEIIGLLVVASYFAVIFYFFILMSSMEKSLKRIADILDKDGKIEPTVIKNPTVENQTTELNN